NRAVCVDAVNKYTCICNSSLYTGSREPCAVGFSGKSCNTRGYVYTGMTTINETFTNGLADKSSKEYLDFLDKFICTVGQGFTQGTLGNSYIPSIVVKTIRRGSIVVVYDATLAPVYNASTDPPTEELVRFSVN
ncbi:unnamed protein product, partial [Owenia fusiformis]